MLYTQSVIHIIFLIFAGAAILSTLALFTRQSLLVAYMMIGAVLGPYGLALVKDSALVKQTGDIGIIFLLFLLGLNLQPQNLLHSLRKMSIVTFISSAIFFAIGFAISFFFGYDYKVSLLVGIAMMFSSTIIGLKLLPTTILHHQHTGELMVSILLLQDIIAIAVLLVLQGVAAQEFAIGSLLMVIIAFPLLLGIAYVFEIYVLAKLMARFDKIHEYIFILSIGWCLCMAELAHYLGLSGEIGAFIAGVALATSPISFYIAENLKPLRDFFLIIFFFAIGAGFNFDFLPQVILPAALLAACMLLIKPATFAILLKRSGETNKLGWEIGTRLGQISEFSLLVIYLALQVKLINPIASSMVQAATILTFIISSYWVVMRYPTPMASSDKLRRD